MTTSPTPGAGWTGIRAAARSVRPHVLPIGIALVLVVPLVVACIALRAEQWAPIYDMAMIEQRVRDVGTAHTPLVGLPGRLGTAKEPASHPGPLAFFLLAPGYHLLGASAWSLYASGALLNAVSIAAFVFVVWRRRSVAELAAASLALGLLMLGYGPTLLCEPWNPYFPVLWFAVFLAAVWAVACRDLAMLPVVAVTASIAAQTHIPYLPVCGLLAAAGVAITVVVTLRAARNSAERRHGFRVLGIAIGIVIIAWLPPLIEELREARGNITLLVRYFSDPKSAPAGLGEALPALLRRMDVRSLLVDPWIAAGGFTRTLFPPVPALLSGVTLAFWISSALAAFALRNRALLTLHGVALLSFGVAVLATSRIVGIVSSHLVLWIFSVAMLLVLSFAATLATLVGRKLPGAWRGRLAALGPALAFAAAALPALRLAAAASNGTRPAAFAQGKLLSALARETIIAIQQNRGLATGRSGRYLVSWSDALYGGALGLSLANELERAGLEVAYERGYVLSGVHRTRDPAWATARIHFALGGWIAEGRNVPSAVLVSRLDLRTAAEESEARELQTQLAAYFRKVGREDLARLIHYDLAGAVAARASQDWVVGYAGARLAEIGLPGAVFVMPPNVVLARRLTLAYGAWQY